MKSRLLTAWIEMFGAVIIAATLLTIDVIRQQPFVGMAEVVFSMSLSGVMAAPLLFMAAVRLRRARRGLADHRLAPPTPSGMTSVFGVGLAVLLALAPALIKL